MKNKISLKRLVLHFVKRFIIKVFILVMKLEMATGGQSRKKWLKPEHKPTFMNICFSEMVKYVHFQNDNGNKKMIASIFMERIEVGAG